MESPKASQEEVSNWLAEQRQVRGLPAFSRRPVVAFDPGAMTGVVEIVQQEVIRACTLSVEELFRELRKESWKGYSTWVIENFALYPWNSRNMSFDVMIPCQVIGALKFCAGTPATIGPVHQNSIVLQWAGNAKTFANDNRLRRVGWYDRCHNKHERDAARHALLYLHSITPRTS